MSLWGIITGAGKVGDVVDTGLGLIKASASGIGKMVYTDEEKAIAGAENVARNMDHALAFAKIAQSESGASAVTRRIFGLIVLGNFTLFVLSGLVAVWMRQEDILRDLVAFASAIMLGELTIAVIVSVFGYYSIGKGKKK